MILGVPEHLQFPIYFLTAIIMIITGMIGFDRFLNGKIPITVILFVICSISIMFFAFELIDEQEYYNIKQNQIDNSIKELNSMNCVQLKHYIHQALINSTITNGDQYGILDHAKSLYGVCS